MSEIDIDSIVAKVTEALSGKMAEIANAATTAQLKRFEAKLEKPAPEPQKSHTVAPEVVDKIKSDPQLAALQAQVEELRKANAEAQKRAEESERKRRDDSAFNALKGALGTQVKPEFQDFLAKALMHVEKRVSFDDNGNPLFKITKELPGGYTEDIEMPLQAGVEHYLKTKDAAPFLPAQASTANPRGGKAPSQIVGVPTGRAPNGAPVWDKPAASDDEKLARAAEMAAFLQKQGF